MSKPSVTPWAPSAQIIRQLREYVFAAHHVGLYGPHAQINVGQESDAVLLVQSSHDGAEDRGVIVRNVAGGDDGLQVDGTRIFIDLFSPAGSHRVTRHRWIVPAVEVHSAVLIACALQGYWSAGFEQGAALFDELGQREDRPT